MSKQKKSKKRVCYQPGRLTTILYLAPSLIIYLLVFIFPVILSVIMSFFRFSSIKNFSFIGLKNYQTLISDSTVWLALKNNIFLVVVCLIGQIGIAFILACILNSKRVKHPGIYRTLIYFPVTLSAVVIGYIWQFVYDYRYGLITAFLKLIGRADLVTPLLSQVDTVMICVCIPMVWQYVGFHLVIMMSAMTAIDTDIYEAAEVDGCTEVQKSLYITFPLIKPTLVICVFLCISASMKAFDHIMAITNGGPGNASTVLALYAYTTSFSNQNMGYGSAISVFILVITAGLFGLSRLPSAIAKRKGNDGEY